MNLDAELEAILFYKNEPVAIKKLAALVNRKEPEIAEALDLLQRRLADGGTALILKDDQAMLGTNPAASSLIENIVKEELSRDLGPAALDTLTIILYYGPITKSRIDHIRGVNSGFILRNLLIRGLISREVNSQDQRSFIYKPTIELFAYLGIKNADELPEYKELREVLDKSLTELDKNEGGVRET